MTSERANPENIDSAHVLFFAKWWNSWLEEDLEPLWPETYAAMPPSVQALMPGLLEDLLGTRRRSAVAAAAAAAVTTAASATTRPAAEGANALSAPLQPSSPSPPATAPRVASLRLDGAPNVPYPSPDAKLPDDCVLDPSPPLEPTAPARPQPAPAQPPLAQIAPSAPVAPVVQPTSYRVYFDWDRSELGAEARGMIDQAVERSRATGHGIHLIGHTDSTGSDLYNMRLSHRRAEAVRTYLLSKAVALADITSEGRGEGEARDSSDDGQRTAQDRYVEIELSTRTPGA